MEGENDIIQKFINCDDTTIEILLTAIIQSQYTKMNDDFNKVINSLRRDVDYSKKTYQMAKSAVVAIYNAEMSYIHVVWDDDKSWWDLDANTRFTSDFKTQFSNCLKDKKLQTTSEWWSRIHILNFKEIIESTCN